MRLKHESYDFIFLGAGCASLSLLTRLLKTGKFSDKKILLIDRAPKEANVRTWCFWETGEGFFEEIVHHRWDQLDFFSDHWSGPLSAAPYRYKMIRGSDFYRFCFSLISTCSNVEIVYAEIGNAAAHKEGVTLELGNSTYQLQADYVFSSLYRPGTARYPLLQHFKGWIIETAKPVFDPARATLMDFRVSQQHGTTFSYVLPLTPQTALVEYTLFSKELLTDEEYDAGLRNYIRDFIKTEDYRVTEVEKGVIPMTDEVFSDYKDGIFYIGTAGGQTKASTGYTFQFIQHQAQEILDLLLAGQTPLGQQLPPRRFRFYDNTLLHILYNNTLPGDRIFSTLFRKNKASRVFRFLDNETGLTDELRILSSLPTWPFLKAAVKSLSR